MAFVMIFFIILSIQVLDMSGMENGVYYMQLQSGSQKATRKITLAH